MSRKWLSKRKVYFHETLISILLLLWEIYKVIIARLLGKIGFVKLRKEDITEEEDNTIEESILKAKDIAEIADAYGYLIREFLVTTRDNYLLVIHKLEKKGRMQNSFNKVAYFQHGLLTNSELFLLGSLKEKILPFWLLDAGYDVWLGNNRGNKYSRKHSFISPEEPDFWDFSLDEYAMYDIPDTLTYIWTFYGGQKKITYFGFSQGCAQFLASLSLKPSLNEIINVFVGLSPALIPSNLNHPIFRILVKLAANDNNFLYSLFGNHALIPSVVFWYMALGPSIYEKIVNWSLFYLFGWTGVNISATQRKIGYPHLFSNSSVKCLIHWFQIIQAQRFQMFEETSKCGMTNLSNATASTKQKSNRVPPFPIAHHLYIPMILVYGDADGLVNIDLTKELILTKNEKMKMQPFSIIRCPGYEHMDTLWGNNVCNDVFLPVIEALKQNDDEKSTIGNDTPLEEVQEEKQAYPF